MQRRLRNAAKRIVPDPLKPLVKRALSFFPPPFVEKALFRHRLTRADPVLVYQMGKVASSSVYNSLKRLYPGAVVHAHGFGPNNEDWKNRALYHWAIIEEKPLRVISLTREPMARNISAFFENFEEHAGVPFREGEFTIEQLRQMFLSYFNHDLPLKWFDMKTRVALDIDVYATPFPDSGFARYSRGNIRLVVLRAELDDATKTAVIKDFLELDRFELINTNSGVEKHYGTTYRQFTSTVKLPREYVTMMCRSKYFTHFYSQEAIDRARIRWTGG